MKDGFIDWNEYKTKNENKNRTNEYRYFFESNFVGANRLFVLVYTNQDAHAKRFKAKIYYVPKELLIIITSSSVEKTFMTKQLIPI